MENKIIMDYLLLKLNNLIGETNKIIEELEESNSDVSRFEEIYSFKNMLCDASNIREIEAEKREKLEEEKFYNEQYKKMEKWIKRASEKELEEHYDWYNVKKGDRYELLYTMWESYTDTYSKEELEERCNMFLEKEEN